MPFSDGSSSWFTKKNGCTNENRLTQGIGKLTLLGGRFHGPWTVWWAILDTSVGLLMYFFCCTKCFSLEGVVFGFSGYMQPLYVALPTVTNDQNDDIHNQGFASECNRVVLCLWECCPYKVAFRSRQLSFQYTWPLQRRRHILNG